MQEWNPVPLAAEMFFRLCRKLNLGDAARLKLTPTTAPREFFEELRRDGLPADAVRVLPHLLPKRVAVWWGCQAVWSVDRAQAPPVVVSAVQAAVEWVIQPCIRTRQSAVKAGELATAQTAAGCVALAAGWSAGSLSLPDLPSVAPPRDLTARLVASAVLLAGVERDAMKYQENYQRLLQLGVDVARGENLWLAPMAVMELPSIPRSHTGDRRRRQSPNRTGAEVGVVDRSAVNRSDRRAIVDSRTVVSAPVLELETSVL